MNKLMKKIIGMVVANIVAVVGAVCIANYAAPAVIAAAGITASFGIVATNAGIFMVAIAIIGYALFRGARMAGHDLYINIDDIEDYATANA